MLIDDEVLNNLLKELEEAKKVKQIIRSAYIHGVGIDFGMGYKDTAIQLSSDNYEVIRNWAQL